jgi:hypothetical protein
MRSMRTASVGIAGLLVAERGRFSRVRRPDSRWQATGSTYWRDLYNVCVNVVDEPPLD